MLSLIARSSLVRRYGRSSLCLFFAMRSQTGTFLNGYFMADISIPGGGGGHVCSGFCDGLFSRFQLPANNGHEIVQRTVQ